MPSQFCFLTALDGCPMFAPAYMGDNDFFKCFHSVGHERFPA